MRKYKHISAPMQEIASHLQSCWIVFSASADLIRCSRPTAGTERFSPWKFCAWTSRSFLAPVDYSCMGYSVPAAIGAKLACPNRPVAALAGDGAFLMTGLELITA